MQAQPAIAELRRAVALEAHTHHHVTRADVAQTDVLSDPLRMTRRQRRVQARVAAWHPKDRRRMTWHANRALRLNHDA